MKRLPTPCFLRRQDCLVGPSLASRLSLPQEESHSSQNHDGVDEAMAEESGLAAAVEDAMAISNSGVISAQAISTFEHIFITYPPIFENLLLHLPTPTVLDLYHTSRTLRKFLQQYPLAWRNLSFRLLTPPPTFVHPQTGSESPDGTDRSKRPYALDLLFRVLMPFSKRLTRLDLDNTSVSGSALRTRILEPQRAILVHLSVRGCKDVSLKYHILPFLQEEVMTPADLLDNTPLAMKSLYTYRCRHHRRRPYLPSSLIRRDSDSQPTHQLIELCHALSIWTDTAWCPTPGPRCFRRKDYYSQRTAMHPAEVWVPFDRLWRSQNFVGVCDDDSKPKRGNEVALQKDCERAYGASRGRLWEEQEYGWAGEALGMSETSLGEGKETPTHARRSHRIYVENYKCDSCGEKILERCEQCSVRMHCMGCRKTLCPSCAFDKPLRKKRRRTVEPDSQAADANTTPSDLSRSRSKRRGFKSRDRFWWAPGAEKSPNLMQENSQEDDSSDDDDEADNNGHNNVVHINRSPRLDLKWCCMEPSFSAGGGIAFIGSNCGDNIRAAPLPQGQGFEDTIFNKINKRPNAAEVVVTQSESRDSDASVPSLEPDDENDPDETSDEEFSECSDFDILPYLEQETNPESSAFQKWSSPRSLCKECYTSPKWRIKCAACDFPICIDHDIKTLKVRRCGYRKLQVERMHIQSSRTYLKDGLTMPKSHMLNMMAGGAFYAKWRPIVSRMLENEAVKKLGQTKTLNTTASTQDKDLLSQSTNLNEKLNCATPVPSEATVKNFAVMQRRSRSLSMSAFSADRESSSSTGEKKSTSEDKWNEELTIPSFRKVAVSSTTDLTTPHEAVRDIPSMEEPAVSVSQTTASQEIPAAPAPIWTGCSRYFCLERETFDRRPPCSSTALRTCNSCTIRVCYICLSQHTPCPCTACSSHGFLCPNCASRPEVISRCCHEEEERERIEREEQEEARERLERERVKKGWEDSRVERELSDGICTVGGEFWRAIEGETEEAGGIGAGLFNEEDDFDDDQWLLELLFGDAV